MIYTIDEIRRKITPICKKYDVKSVNIFGSYSRGEATDASDIDFHVDKTGSKKLKSMLDMGEFREDLVDVLQKNVDIVTYVSHDYYNQLFCNNLLHDEINIYYNQ